MTRTTTETRVVKSQRINLRATDRQEALLRQAAEATDHTLTDFILDSAVDNAQRVLADRRWFVATDEQFDEFVRLLDAPLPSTEKIRSALCQAFAFRVTGLTAPRKLAKSDVRAGFVSGAGDLDEWLVKYSWQNQQANNATTYVMTDSERVVGYYAIAMSAVAKLSAPEALQQGRPAQISCILLARLAVDDQYKGEGLGWELLRDALLRSVTLSESIGAAAVLVHCRDESAKQFYLHHGDFLESPVDELHLIVPMKSLRRYVD